jgi:integrase
MGVNVVTNRRGYLRFRIFWRGSDVAVSTRYRDDGPSGRNTRLVAAKALLIEEKLRTGAELHQALLGVLGDCPPRLMPAKPVAPTLVTLRIYYEGWIRRKQPPLVRASAAKKHRRCFVGIILPELGDEILTEIGKARLEAFRAKLLTQKTRRGTLRTVKATRNIIDWHLRSLWRDAEREGIAGSFPRLDWPRLRRPKPDPFEPEERNKILVWFSEREAQWYPWVHFLFWTGMRHGEAAALRWSDVDLRRGIVSITKSRDEREENDPKTPGSLRDIPLLPWVVEMLKKISRPLHSDGSEYVFTTPEGKPMTDSWWPKRGAARRVDPSKPETYGMWFRCLRSLGLRARKAYCTRHTFIAWALSEGANLKGLAEYCGTSVQMIEQSYGRYIRTDFLEPLLEAGDPSKREAKTATVRGSGTPKNRTLNRTPATFKTESGGRSTGYRMEAGGIEPPSESGPSRAST